MTDFTRENYRYEAGFENEISVVEHNDGSIQVSVSQEKAVDSYNDTFECDITLPLAEARKLRDWLVANVHGCTTLTPSIPTSEGEGN